MLGSTATKHWELLEAGNMGPKIIVPVPGVDGRRVSQDAGRDGT